jgi:hypothetical protein
MTIEFGRIAMKKFVAIFGLALFCFLSCDGGGSSFDPEKSSYGEATETSTGQYVVDVVEGGTRTYVAKKTDTVTKDGVELSVITAVSTETTREILVSPFPLSESDKTVTFGGFTSTSGTEITPEKPVEIDLFPPVGEEVPINENFTATLPGMSVSSEFNFTGTYTLESDDATAQTPNGSYSGLMHYTGKGKISGDLIPVILQGGDLTGELWISPVLGIIAYKIPELGIGGDMESTWDYGDPDELGHKAVRKTGVINAENPSFALDTYEIAGGFDADKDTHAKMLLEIRYLDEDLAKTGPIPGYPAVNIEFGVPMGYFPSFLVESPVSIFHPEENGKGYKYFIGYVDQASKNSLSNPISYHIKVDADTSASSDMRVTARIYYNKIEK